MANTDKNILITPNTGSGTSDPTIQFTGGNTTVANSINAAITADGVLSFSGTAGQLFSITNSLSGTIFSVNDISGIPSIEVLDTGLVKIAQYNGNVAIGNATVPTGYVLDVAGNINASGSIASDSDSSQVATTQWVRDQGGFQTFGNVHTTGTGLTGIIPAWANKIKVTVVGGGGAGGGTPATTGTVGAGGGGGAVSIKYFTGVAGQTYNFNVGVGGTGASGAIGGAGRPSNILIGTTLVNAPGGSGGNLGVATTNVTGGLGGVAGTGGDINLPGSPGGNAHYLSATAGQSASGFGGPGWAGGGGGLGVRTAAVGNSPGNPGTAGTGAGGSGSVGGAATATAGTGGNGGAGAVIIEW